MATQKSSASAQPSTEDHNNTIEAHYSGLERLCPHACEGGFVFVGHVDVAGEEEHSAYPCRRCQQERGEVAIYD